MHHNESMRTTISIDDDVLAEAKTYATARQVPLGRAVSDLIRRGLTAKTPTRVVNGLLVFDPPGSPVLTSERVKEFLDNEP
jgi:Arc/MetJ family transcription regulator